MKSLTAWNPHPQYLAGIALQDKGDIRGAMKAYRKAAKLNDSDAQSALANLLDERNKPIEAVYWYKRSARQKNPTGAYNLAIHYGNLGQLRWLLHWLRVAKKLGNKDVADEAFERAEYLIGQGNVNLAAVYLAAAAKLGDACAQNNLAIILETKIKPFRVREALSWYRKAVRGGSKVAASNLALHYRDNDKPLAQLRWLRVAAKMGYPGAKADIRRLERALARR